MSADPTLRDWLNDEQTINDALAILKVGIDGGDRPVEAFRRAVASVLLRWLPDEPPRFRSHDERIARCNRIFREFVKPLLPPDEIALLIITSSAPGLCCYMSNGERRDCATFLREFLAKWDAEGKARA